jgi:hypothetical protein
MRKLSFALLLLSACSDSEPPPATGASPSARPPKSRVIAAPGAPYAEADYLVPEYATILEFYADW